MKNLPGRLPKVSFFLLLLVSPVLAQTWSHDGAAPAATGPTPHEFKAPPAAVSRWEHSGAPPAATGPAFNFSVGYSYLAMPIPAAASTHLNGLDLSSGIDVNRHFGAKLDSSYVRTGNILGTKHIGYLLSFLGGPVFYPFAHGDTRTFVEALGGVGMVDGAVPISATSYFHGWQARFSYALGGGIERPIFGPFAVRAGADFLRTSFYNGAGVIQPQNNFRMTVGFVYQFNAQRQRRPVLK
jgi:hypothetical protein